MSFFVENKMIVNTGETPVRALNLNHNIAGSFLPQSAGASTTASDQTFASRLFKGRTQNKVPTLPQTVAPQELAKRKFDLSLKRTAYNYTNTYFDGVSVSGNLPPGEEYDDHFKSRIFETALIITENFKNVVLRLLKENMANHMPDGAAIDRLRVSFDKLREGEFSIFNLKKEMVNIDAFVASLNEVIESVSSLEKLPKDLEKILFGFNKLTSEFSRHGAPALMKSSMYDLLSTEHGRDYRHATHVDDYDRLFDTIKKPQVLSIERQPWMTSDDKPCLQDWFFGQIQTAGFNTTNLRGVQLAPSPEARHAVVLADLLGKMPISEAVFQSVIQDPSMTLERACRERLLYVCDYTDFSAAWADKVFDEQRYVAAPIAVFYWNSRPPAGYPPLSAGVKGVLQPVAIQLGQEHDPEISPIFTPNDATNANDSNSLKWKLAKFVVNATCAMHHESVAHLLDCHIVVEPIILATHRQLAQSHPLFKLLHPHFRFTININYDARNTLIVPGGVVATNVGTAIESTFEMIADAFKKWRWDENAPDRVYRARGTDHLPDFALRDDTILLWDAILKFVDPYVRLYYASDADVVNDHELQGWVNELMSERHAGFKGLDGLKETGNPKAPYGIDNIDYLVRMVAQIIYIAGPLHASVNNAQYELMSYMPSIGGTIYNAMPTRSMELESEQDLLKWYPPLDIALYTFSFEYLLGEVQYDRFGHYSFNPRESYWGDTRVAELELDLHDRLALVEIEIRKRNKSRPLPFPHQLPSLMPNSICI
jgi:arachidonate 15-lipoxygenase